MHCREFFGYIDIITMGLKGLGYELIPLPFGLFSEHQLGILDDL